MVGNRRAGQRWTRQLTGHCCYLQRHSCPAPVLQHTQAPSRGDVSCGAPHGWAEFCQCPHPTCICAIMLLVLSCVWLQHLSCCRDGSPFIYHAETQLKVSCKGRDFLG